MSQNSSLPQAIKSVSQVLMPDTAGLSVIAERNRRDFALSFFDQMRARTAAAGGPPPLGLHILMGRNTPEKLKNMIQNISDGRIAPVELIARKA